MLFRSDDDDFNILRFSGDYWADFDDYRICSYELKRSTLIRKDMRPFIASRALNRAPLIEEHILSGPWRAAECCHVPHTAGRPKRHSARSKRTRATSVPASPLLSALRQPFSRRAAGLLAMRELCHSLEAPLS